MTWRALRHADCGRVLLSSGHYIVVTRMVQQHRRRREKRPYTYRVGNIVGHIARMCDWFVVPGFYRRAFPQPVSDSHHHDRIRLVLWFADWRGRRAFALDSLKIPDVMIIGLRKPWR